MRSRFASMVVPGVLAALMAAPSNAAEIGVLDAGDGMTIITIEGEIRQGDADKFRKEAAGLENDAVVMLESPGGSTVEAIEMGEVIRLRGFTTYVANGFDCVSACALIWIAGTPRAISESARIGFHASYIDEQGKKLESGLGNALVGRYFTLLNLPMKAVVFATAPSPTELSWLDKDNAESLGIETKIIGDLDEPENSVQPDEPRLVSPPLASVEPRVVPPALPSDEPRLVSPPLPSVEPRVVSPPLASDDSSVETQTWAKVGKWQIAVDHTLGDSCFILRFYDDGAVFRIGNDVRFGSKKGYILLTKDGWESLKPGASHPMSYIFEGHDAWEAASEVVDMGGLKLLETVIDQEFWDEFRTSKALYVYREMRQVGTLPLDGSQQAYQSLLKCQASYDKKRNARDPFAGK